MRTKRVGGRSAFLPLLFVLPLLALTLALGTAFARYYAASEAELLIGNAAELDQVYFLDPDGTPLADGAWKRAGEADTYYLDLLLSNGNGAEQYVQRDLQTALRVVSTVADDPAVTTVRLLVGGEVYTGTPEPILRETVLGRQYGDGYLYRFFNGAGEELNWHLRGGRSSQLRMRLQVTGGAEGTVFTLMTARTAES